MKIFSPNAGCIGQKVAQRIYFKKKLKEEIWEMSLKKTHAPLYSVVMTKNGPALKHNKKREKIWKRIANRNRGQLGELCDDVILEICKFLPTDDLFSRFKLICKDFYQLFKMGYKLLIKDRDCDGCWEGICEDYKCSTKNLEDEKRRNDPDKKWLNRLTHKLIGCERYIKEYKENICKNGLLRYKSNFIVDWFDVHYLCYDCLEICSECKSYTRISRYFEGRCNKCRKEICDRCHGGRCDEFDESMDDCEITWCKKCFRKVKGACKGCREEYERYRK